MRALSFVCGVVCVWSAATAVEGQSSNVPDGNQVASCPTILPVEAGERSIIVPSVAPQFAQHTAVRALDGMERGTLPIAAETRRARAAAKRNHGTSPVDQHSRACARASESIGNRSHEAGPGRHRIKIDGRVVQIDRLAPILRGEQGFGVATVDNTVLSGVFEMLEKQQFAKTIATPNIVTMSGVPASLHVGGEIPVPPAEQGGAITTKEYGTRLNVTATTLGDNRVRLAIHPRVAEVDNTQGIDVGGQRIPAITLREVDSVCELKLGESFLISGLVQQRSIAKPGWSLQKKEEIHEIALVVVATPELVR